MVRPGRNWRKECLVRGSCHTGDAKLTKGYRLPARLVIHRVGPVWKNGNDGDSVLLAARYDSYGIESTLRP